jgi:ATP-dependent RNA helicase DeaD
MTPKLFTELGLSPESLKAVERLGFEQASPIQAEAIPVLLGGRDVVGQSQTGSGKTAAFGLPAIEKIDPKGRGVQVLVLCPTRELAVQVSEEIHKLAHFNRAVKPLPIFGGAGYDRQYAGLRAGANIVIGTPGRVQDHLERGSLKLDQVRMVILDEADEMLDMGFREDIEKILQHAPPERQTVLFSATIPRPIEELIRRFTRDPVRVQIEAKALTVPTVEQIYHEVHPQWKFEALTRLVDLHEVKLGIVFCNTQRAVDEITEHLHAAGYDADALHGGLAQPARDRVMKKFKTGVLSLLVATDVAGRGIDVNDVEVVFNFDLPHDPEDYVHRIGRTGRAGRSGKAISLVSGREFFRIRHLERFTRQRITRGKIPSQDELAEAKDRKLLDDVRTVIQHGDLTQREQMVQALMDEGFDTVQIASALLHLLVGGPVPDVESAGAEPVSRWADHSIAKPAAKPPAPAEPPAQVPVSPPSPKVAVEATPTEAPVEPPAPAPEKPAKRKTKKTPAEPAAPTARIASAKPVVIEPAPVATPEPPAVVEVSPEPVPEAAAVSAPQSAMAPVAPTVPPVAKPTSAPAPVERPAASKPPAADQPPKLKPSTWGRPRFAPRFDRTEPAAPESHPRPEPPARRFEQGREFPSRDRSFGREPNRDFDADNRPERAPRNRFEPRPPGPEPRSNRFSARPDNMMVELWVSVGEADGIAPRDIVGCILGETGLPKDVVGTVNVAERHTLVAVERGESRRILTALNRAQLRGRRMRAKLSEY